jgi:hypothetical protein
MARKLSRTVLALCVLAICHAGLADDAHTSNAAIQQTLQQASNNPQVANTNARTTSAAVAPVASVAAATNPASSGTAQGALPTSLQAADVNKGLLQATQLATQVVQNAPPVTG